MSQNAPYRHSLLVNRAGLFASVRIGAGSHTRGKPMQIDGVFSRTVKAQLGFSSSDQGLQAGLELDPNG